MRQDGPQEIPRYSVISKHSISAHTNPAVLYSLYRGESTFFAIAKWKWNKSGFMPLLCTYMLNWARRTSWGWWDDRDDTALLTQDKIPWRYEAEHAISRSRRLPTILSYTGGWGRSIFFFKPNSSLKGSGANHQPRTPALFNMGVPERDLHPNIRKCL